MKLIVIEFKSVSSYEFVVVFYESFGEICDCVCVCLSVRVPACVRVRVGLVRVCILTLNVGDLIPDGS